MPKANFWAILALAAMVATGASCDRSNRWGTPEYFERLVGRPFTPEGVIVRCQQETGFDYVAFRRVVLPRQVAADIQERPATLARLPRQLEYERERTIRRWTKGPFSTEAQQAFELALAGAIAAIEESRCGGITVENARSSVQASITKPTTFYTFQYLSPDGRVQPMALDFRILDPIDGVLFELVDFS